MGFCRKCGKELKDGDVFCPQCGSGTNLSSKKTGSGGRAAVYVIVTVLTLITAITVASLLFPPEQGPDQHSYKMTFTIDWYTVLDASGTVDNDFDGNAEVYFQVSYGEEERLLLIDTEDPLGYYSTRSAPVHTDENTAMANKIYPSEYRTTVFYIAEGETTASITIFMFDYDGPANFSEKSYDDILDIYDDGSSAGGSSSQGIRINLSVGEDRTEEIGGDADPRGFLGYTVSFEAV